MILVDDETFVESMIPLIENGFYTVTLWDQDVDTYRLEALMLNPRTRNSLCFTPSQQCLDIENQYKQKIK